MASEYGKTLTFWIIISNWLVLCASQQRAQFDLRMPDVAPVNDDAYMCSARLINKLTDGEYLVGLQPAAHGSRVHHMLVYGCSMPGVHSDEEPNLVWDCGSMDKDDTLSSYSAAKGPPCKQDYYSEYIYGWAPGASALDLSPSFGFKIGPESGINYLVLQVHYSDTSMFRLNPNLHDDSGFLVKTVMGPEPGITKLVGTMPLASYGYVDKGITRHRIDCEFTDKTEIHPFKFRVHTHQLGVMVGGYVIPQGSDKPILIGERSPQEPQMFYPVADDSIAIRHGDLISVYCDFNNDRDHIVQIGSSHHDEMCNLFIMYWTEAKSTPSMNFCTQYNPRP